MLCRQCAGAEWRLLQLSGLALQRAVALAIASCEYTRIGMHCECGEAHGTTQAYAQRAQRGQECRRTTAAFHGIKLGARTRAKSPSILHLGAGSRSDARVLNVLADELRILSADCTAEGDNSTELNRRVALQNRHVDENLRQAGRGRNDMKGCRSRREGARKCVDSHHAAHQRSAGPGPSKRQGWGGPLTRGFPKLPHNSFKTAW